MGVRKGVTMKAVSGNKRHGRRRFSRSIKKAFFGILLAPARIPRITGEKVERLMSFSEITAICFVAVLMLHMIVPDIIGTFAVILVGAVFAVLLGMILLADYQDKLVEYELYGFKI